MLASVTNRCRVRRESDEDEGVTGVAVVERAVTWAMANDGVRRMGSQRWSRRGVVPSLDANRSAWLGYRRRRGGADRVSGSTRARPFHVQARAIDPGLA